ncbi:hypothetical protein J3459_013737 [Metarhizium acridum]|uniref:uncharacterized protein n=1 Tax=Metarhizium acridum TaxID=92637 RepID=UPI001C6C1639|nr:hypothetical protein J3458_013289 [Metarhizium acridum]KAG8416156.1 hypothetical protein J3459_013737 [Metarhizium acridum]
MAPLSAAISKDTDPLDALKLAWISRKLQTLAGANEFNHRHLHEHRGNTPKSYGIEILYNFFGRNDQFDYAESIFIPILNLTKLIDAIPQNSAFWTVADVPLANLEQAHLDKTTSHLARAGIDLRKIEEIHPATPAQEGILVSQQKAPEQYISSTITKLSLASGRKWATSRLADAYSQVIRRHPMLRTLFVESNGDHLYDQVVLKHWTPVLKSCHQVMKSRLINYVHGIATDSTL